MQRLTYTRFRRWLLLLPFALPLACDGGTDPLVPSALEVVEGQGQTGTVGSRVPVPPAVRVTTSDGRAVAGVDVVFTVNRGGGSIAGSTAQTDLSGVARFEAWTLGTQAGEQAINATSPRIPGAYVTITATAIADAPAALGLSRQPATGASSGTPLSTQPVVQLLDRFGNPAPGAGVTVTARVSGAPAGLALTNAAATTDATGAATFTGLTLTGRAGSYTLEFTAPGLSDARAASTTELAAGAPHHLRLETEPGDTVLAGQKITPAPVVRLLDEHDNPLRVGEVPITAALEDAGATLGGTTTVTTTAGEAVFDDLTISAPGTYRLRFTAPELGSALSAPVTVAQTITLDCTTAGTGALRLDFAPGYTVRRTTDSFDAPTCLEFDAAQATGHQYLVLFENLPLYGDSDNGLFSTGATSPGSFSFSVLAQPAIAVAGTAATVAARRAFPNALGTAAGPGHFWDFGTGPIYEGIVDDPPGGLPLPRLVQGGRNIELTSSMAPADVGDTVQVFLQGIPRLGIAAGTQKAVVRHVSQHLIIAEDVRLSTLARKEGGTNTPLTQAVMDSIAAEYAAHAQVQGDLFFESRYNSATEAASNPPRVLAVHTLMYSDDVWGYTYPSGTYFAFDYWVGTNGSTRGLSQHPQRVADNLFMHEIAHIRHYGMVERSGVGVGNRGNRWLVEGFARFSERLPIAARLLGTTTPSRTGNIVLPRNPAFGNAYYRDDVPTYLQAGSNMLAGYGASSFVFDYFADQVAATGRDPIVALRDLLVHAGRESTVNAVIDRWLPGLTFPELFTRARIALFADDYTPGLPASTQYLQFRLRESRPPGSATADDPRNAWLRLKPGRLEQVDPVSLARGTARGIIIDGTVPDAASARILIDAERGPNGVISITRIR